MPTALFSALRNPALSQGATVVVNALNQATTKVEVKSVVVFTVDPSPIVAMRAVEFVLQMEEAAFKSLVLRSLSQVLLKRVLKYGGCLLICRGPRKSQNW
jgi:hypothetical protein